MDDLREKWIAVRTQLLYKRWELSLYADKRIAYPEEHRLMHSFIEGIVRLEAEEKDIREKLWPNYQPE